MTTRLTLKIALAITTLLALPASAFAQHDHAAMMAAAAARWTWNLQGQASLNLNLQQRKFTDFHQVESQNWFMVMGGRRVGSTSVSLHTMFSFEPFTMRDVGSAQVFQTGELFDGRRLIDYQHPHDLFMGLGATWSGNAGRAAKWSITGAVVGEPTLGPTAFMHRVSSEGNPTAPLGHHTLDSTHITHGVVAGALTFRDVTVEASTFHGREPDEDRLDIEMGPLDSVAGRVWWRRGPWAVQASAGHLKTPEAATNTDLNRYTTSVEYKGLAADSPWNWTLAYGLNHLPNYNGLSVMEAAILGDATYRWSPRNLLYARFEVTDKDIDSGHFALPGDVHPKNTITAFTVGYQRRLISRGRRSMALGGDVTVYGVPIDLQPNYGHPLSMHVLLILKSN